MTQFEFISRLRRSLVGLPDEEIDRAVEYYEDYFRDADADGEADVIEKFGDPEVVAEKIRREIAGRSEAGFTEHGYEDIPTADSGVVEPVTSIEPSDYTANAEREDFQENEKVNTNGNSQNFGSNNSNYGGNYNGSYNENYSGNHDRSYGGNYSGNDSESRHGSRYHDDFPRKKQGGCFRYVLVGAVIVCLLIILAIVAVVSFAKMSYVGIRDALYDTAREFSSDDDDDEDDDMEYADRKYQQKQEHQGTASAQKKQEIDDYYELSEAPQGIKLDADTGKIKIKEGDVFSVSITKKSDGIKFTSKVTDEGIWELESKQGGSTKEILKNFFGNGTTMKATITIPKDYHAETFVIEMDAGSITAETLIANNTHISINAGSLTITELQTDDISLSIDAGSAKIQTLTADQGKIELSAGSLTINHGNTDDMKMQCDMGSIDYSGIFGGKNTISCDMGSITLDLENDIANYTIHADNSMGTIKVNGEKLKGMDNSVLEGKGDTRLDVSVDMGTVKIDTK